MKKQIALILLIICIFSCLFTTGAIAFAEVVDIDTSYVLDDLNGSLIAGEQFNADNYGYSTEKEPVVLSFAEYGYSFDKSTVGDYRLYLYIYNPSGKEIRDTALNKVSIATYYENGQAVDYDKFELQLLSVSNDKYANLFYKFKVKNTDKIWTRVSANTSSRRYDVGEIELNYGATTSVAYNVGNYYEYSGFAKGYGADAKAESTLTCVTDRIQTLQLDVHSASYVYNNGETIKSNLSSVYFGVADDYFDRYGFLQQIKANWYMTHTDYQYFLYDKSLYNSFKNYIGYAGTYIPADKFVDDNGKTHKSIMGFDGTDYTNDPVLGSLGPYGIRTQNYTFGGCSGNLNWLFYCPNDSTYTVTSAEIMEYAKTFTKNVPGELLLDKYNKYLFADISKYAKDYKVSQNGVSYLVHFGWQGEDGQGVVIDADSKFTINGMSTSAKLSNWWKNLIRDFSGFDTASIENISPIYTVEDSDLNGNNATIASRLLIDESEVDNFKEAYKINKLQGKKTILFRYAVTPYFVDKAYASTGSAMFSQRVGWCVQQFVPLDFDVIWLKFVLDEQETVIPVCANPIDAFSSFRPPESDDDLFDKIIKILSVILGVILLLVIISVLAPLLPLLWKGIKCLIMLPVKAVKSVVNAFKKRKK